MENDLLHRTPELKHPAPPASSLEAPADEFLFIACVTAATNDFL
ncbi:hypothetical protein C4K39_3349 [Pseudomonas sessilinigenes]|nr:hypothetical protein C4K39_3349 [Pseudomonas sessilinigenes]